MARNNKARRPSSARSTPPPAAPPPAAPPPEEDEELIEQGQGLDAPPAASRANKKRKRAERDALTSARAVRSSAQWAFYEGMLLELLDKPECQDFSEPVLTLWSAHDVPGYLDKIKQPMDLGTVRRHMQGERYIVHDRKSGTFGFDCKAMARDVRLVFHNCMEYNEPSSALYATAKRLLDDVNAQIAENEAHVARERDKERREMERKRENERKRRKAAEEEAALAASQAKKAAAALEKVRREAKEAERRRLEELRRKEAEWAARLKQEKARAVQEALDELLAKQRKERRGGSGGAGGGGSGSGGGGGGGGVGGGGGGGGAPSSSVVNTSSVSSDEHEAGIGEVTFTFVSTEGMEKKRGRKSAVVMELEVQHDDLMKRRKAMVEMCVELNKMKQIELSVEEKHAVCEQVGRLDFVRMKAVVDMIARGMNRMELLNEVSLEMDINEIDNKVLRDIQFFLRNPAAHTAKDALRHIEAKITDIETRLVEIRYQKVG